MLYIFVFIKFILSGFALWAHSTPLLVIIFRFKPELFTGRKAGSRLPWHNWFDGSDVLSTRRRPPYAHADDFGHLNRLEINLLEFQAMPQPRAEEARIVLFQLCCEYESPRVGGFRA